MQRIRPYHDNCPHCGKPRLVVYNLTANASLIYCVECNFKWIGEECMVHAEEAHVEVDGCSVRLQPGPAIQADAPTEGTDTVLGRQVTTWRCPDCGKGNSEIGSVYHSLAACSGCGLTFNVVY